MTDNEENQEGDAGFDNHHSAQVKKEATN
jgi:hypothetical protein